jgi:thiol:disulfide interchange protein DsbC
MLRYAVTISLMICAAASGAHAAAAQTPVEQPAAQSAAQTAAQPVAADPRVALLKLLPAGAKLDDLQPSPIAGIYQFTQGAEVSYLTADGKYFLDGNLYDMKSRDNLTEALRTHARIAMINAVPETEMLIFSPPNPKYTITVFTDVDCAYCRKLHSQIAELNKLGHPGSLYVLPAHGAGNRELEESGSRLVFAQPQRGADPGEGRRDPGHEQDLRADTRQAGI